MVLRMPEAPAAICGLFWFKMWKACPNKLVLRFTGQRLAKFPQFLRLQIQEAGEEGMADAGPNITTPAAAATPAAGSQLGMEWQAATQRWVESSGKPPFRVVPDDSKPTLRDPLSTSDPVETEHILLRPPPFNRDAFIEAWRAFVDSG